MSELTSGQQVILLEEYNGKPAGTLMYYMYTVEDSGSYVPLCLIDDERTREAMKSLNAMSIQDLINIFTKDARQGNSISLALIYCSTLKPWPRQIKSLSAIDKEIAEAQEKLTTLQAQRELFLQGQQ